MKNFCLTLLVTLLCTSTAAAEIPSWIIPPAIRTSRGIMRADGNNTDETAISYKFTIDCKELLCPDDNDDFHITFKGDARIASFKYLLVTEVPTTEDETQLLLSNLNTTGTPATVNEAFTINLNQLADGNKIVGGAFDADGVMQNVAAAAIPYHPDVPDEWESIGMATFTEGFICSQDVLPQFFSPETYDVEVEQNKANPGLIRIVNPYDGWSNTKYVLNHAHRHYIYINIENPDKVYITESPLGLRIDPYGEFLIDSLFAQYISIYGESSKDWNISGGTLKDGIISYDGNCNILIYPTSWGQYLYANYKDNPDYDASRAEEPGYNVPKYLGGDFRLDLTRTTGVTDLISGNVDNDAAVAEYYNLQGVRLDRPMPGINIERRGTTTRKIIIR